MKTNFLETKINALMEEQELILHLANMELNPATKKELMEEARKVELKKTALSAKFYS